MLSIPEGVTVRHSILERALCLNVLVLVASLTSAQERFTIEQILSSPFPSELIAAPNHGTLAWVQNAEGRRNIWIALAPDYVGRQLTSYDSDDGRELSQLRFGPGANHIVFVRGGAPNRQARSRTHEASPMGLAQSIWILAVEGGALREIGEGSGFSRPKTRTSLLPCIGTLMEP
jgi:hypothetical protein